MNFKLKRNADAKRQRIDKIQYRALIGLIVFWLLYRWFWQPLIIGHDSRYYIYIFSLPVTLGVLILFYYERPALMLLFTTPKSWANRIVTVLFFTIQSIVLSYFSLGQLTAITWDVMCKKVAAQTEQEVILSDITAFKQGGRRSPPKIEFSLHNRREHMDVSHEYMRKYKDENPKDYYIQIGVRKGIWNYYVVNYFEVKERSVP